MIKYSVLLFMLSISATHANGEIHFSGIPANITTVEAITAVGYAAQKRKWTVSNLDNGKLRVNLNHNDYKAVLDFSFSERDIYYSDFTTYIDQDVNEDEDSLEAWEAKAVPRNWLANLKRDVDGFFLILKNIKHNRGSHSLKNNHKETLSYENVEIKLDGLKKLYDKRLIAESEYKLKKKEIMSRY